MIDFSNFYCSTIADFKYCKIPRRKPDFYSMSGSTYWDDGDKVIRWSNHWGPNIRSCDWYFNGLVIDFMISGYCFYSDFKLHNRPIRL